MNNIKIKDNFFEKKSHELAQNLLGKFICRKFEDGSIQRWCITETEAYEHKENVTYKNEMFFGVGEWCPYSGMIMINCYKKDQYDNVLIRALDCIKGPCNIVKELKIKEISKDIIHTNVISNDKLWLEDWGIIVNEPKKNPRKGLVKNEKNNDEIEVPKNFQAKILCYPFNNA